MRSRLLATLTIWSMTVVQAGTVHHDSCRSMDIKNQNDLPDINAGKIDQNHKAFEENKGQVRTVTGDAAPYVRYRFSQQNTTLFLLDNGIAFQFTEQHYPVGYQALVSDRSTAHRTNTDPENELQLIALREKVRSETFRMDMVLEGMNPNARITADGKSSDYTQYYTYDALNVHTFTKVSYHDVYPGIDWVVYITDAGIKYDFVVRPGADPSQILLRFTDHEELKLDKDGRLIHGNRLGRFTEDRPVSFQNAREISTRFVLKNDLLMFAIDTYDPTATIVIDPARIWGTYYGGLSHDQAFDMELDSIGNIYICGSTHSSSAIAMGGHQNTFGGGGGDDAFIVKFDASGIRQWATYYGGGSGETGYSCTVDIDGNPYLAGISNSTSAIAYGGHQLVNNGNYDAFLVKFNANGVRQWATYFGGQSYDQGLHCTTDSDNNVYLSGLTASDSSIASDFSHQTMHGGGDYDAFIAKFDQNGLLKWSTYYGGWDTDKGFSCAVDSLGYVYLCGNTRSSISISSGGHQNTLGGVGYDAFLVKFSANGTRQWGTYYGGADSDFGSSCAVDEYNNVYLCGYTRSVNGIFLEGQQEIYGGGNYDAMLVKFNDNGVRQWGTYYGGENDDSGDDCTVDGNGSVYLSGNTNSTSDISSGGHQVIFGGGARDAFLVKFDVDGVRQWGTYYGGTGDEYGQQCVADDMGDVLLVGTSSSTEAIAAVGHQNVYGGGESDAFLVKFNGDLNTVVEQNVVEPSTDLDIFPNPTLNECIILLPLDAQAIRILVMDAAGREALAPKSINTSGPIKLDLNSLVSGLYIVQVELANKARFQRKIVKE